MTSEPDLHALVVQALGVFTRGRTYLNLLYLLLSLPLAIVYFVVLLFSAAAGAVLSIVGIGLLILLGGLAAAWGFAVLERELAISLLVIELPPPPALPQAPLWTLRLHTRSPSSVAGARFCRGAAPVPDSRARG